MHLTESYLRALTQLVRVHTVLHRFLATNITLQIIISSYLYFGLLIVNKRPGFCNFDNS